MAEIQQQDFDVLVVGAGPAGMAAAVRAAECGARVGLVDDNPHVGGQIWRTGVYKDSEAVADTWRRRLKESSASVLAGLRVFGQVQRGVLLAEGNSGPSAVLSYRKLILSTGARERFLPFPGWTLPNVSGAGGLQALVKNGLSVRGKRVVVAGTGPLLLAVAHFLRKNGADVPTICEQASFASVLFFGTRAALQSGKFAQSIRLGSLVTRPKFFTNAWVIAAEGKGRLESVTVVHSGKQKSLRCDYLACGYHLVPNTELASLLGCALQNGRVQVDDFQRTSVESVFCAGEPTGIAGVESALIQGQIAGLTAAGREQDAAPLRRKLHAMRSFAGVLEKSFALRPELRDLPEAGTIVCRCEDVTYGDLRDHQSWRAAKLYTRCGMGPCQARICGAAMHFLKGWDADTVRPPAFPVRLSTLALTVEASSASNKGGRP